MAECRSKQQCDASRKLRRVARQVTLPELRATPTLAEMVLLRRGSRLSVQPVTAAEWKVIVKLGARA